MSGPTSEQPDDSDKQSAIWFSLSGLGLEFVLSLLVPGFAGWWLDKHLSTSPWLLLVGISLGFAIGLYTMVRTSNKLFKK